jgi:heterodisulfide reductase subunit A-like polyferredoxin
MRIAVIGSGLGGLAAAATLAARGYQVEVFEKNLWLGGKAAVLNESVVSSVRLAAIWTIIFPWCGWTRNGVASLTMAPSLI